MAELERILARIEGDTSQLRAELARGQRSTQTFARQGGASVRSFGDQMEALRKRIFNVRTALVAVAGITALGFFIQRQLAAADAIAKTADRIGISTDALQELRFAAGIAGVSISQLDTGLARFVRNMGDLARSSSETQTALRDLDAELLNNLRSTSDVNRQLELAFERLAAIEDPARRASVAVALFGRAGQAFTLMAQDVTDLRQEARDLGLVLEEELLRNSERANDELSKLAQVIGTQLTRVVIENADSITRLATSLLNASVNAAKFLGILDRTEEEALERVQQRMADIQNDIQTATTELLRMEQRLSEVGTAAAAQMRARMRLAKQQVLELQAALADLGEEERRIQERIDAREDISERRRQLEAQRETMEAIEAIARTLEFEREQLDRTTVGRQLYTLAQQAGIEVTEEYTQAIMPLLIALEEEKKRLDDLRESERQAGRAADDLRRRKGRLIETTRTAAEQYEATTEELAKLREELEAIGELTPEVEEALRRAGEQAKKTFEDAQNQGRRTNDVMREMGATFQSAFEDAIVSGRRLSDVLQGLQQDMLRIFLRRQVMGPLFDVIFGGGEEGGGIFGSLFGGFREHGGPVSAGRAYVVGERRPEVFVPNSSGRILPSVPTGGSSSGRTEVRVHVAPGTQVTEERQQFGDLERINLFIDQAVADAMRRPGSKTRRTMQGTFGLDQQVISR